MNPANVAATINTITRLAQVALVGGAAVYGASHSLFTVEGGHRAVVFNRLVGLKEDVSGKDVALSGTHQIPVCSTVPRSCDYYACWVFSWR